MNAAENPRLTQEDVARFSTGVLGELTVNLMDEDGGMRCKEVVCIEDRHVALKEMDVQESSQEELEDMLRWFERYIERPEITEHTAVTYPSCPWSPSLHVA